MKRGLLISVISFAVTLAIIFGMRASADALAVVLGVVLGIIASVPTTFLVTYMLTRPPNNGTPSPLMSQQPPIVVINAPDKPAISSPPTLPALSSASQTRKWTVIGDIETDMEA